MMKKIRLGTMLLTFVLLMSSALVGCAETDTNTSANPADAGKITLELWDWWGDGTHKAVIEQIVSDFNASQDKIVVKHVHYPWGDVWTKALAATAAGNPPDIVIQDINSVPTRADAKQSMDLQPYIDKEPGFKDKFYPQLWDATVHEGHSYGIPFTTDTRLLFYDKDMFKEAGLDPEAPPSTWDELIETARKLDKVSDDGNIERLGFYPLTHVDWDFWALNASGGQSFLQPDGTVTVNTPEKLAAVKWVKENYFDYYTKRKLDAFTAEFGNGMTNPFVSGKVAMIAQTATEFTKVRDFAPDKNYGMAFIPEFKEGSGYWSWGGGFTAEIPVGAKHPDASWEFVKYLTDTKAQTYWATQVYDSVANIEAAESKEALSHPVFQKATENMEWTALTPFPVFAPSHMDLVKPKVEEVWIGKKTPEEAMAEAQKAVEDLVQRNKK